MDMRRDEAATRLKQVLYTQYRAYNEQAPSTTDFPDWLERSVELWFIRLAEWQRSGLQYRRNPYLRAAAFAIGIFRQAPESSTARPPDKARLCAEAGRLMLRHEGAVQVYDAGDQASNTVEYDSEPHERLMQTYSSEFIFSD